MHVEIDGGRENEALLVIRVLADEIDATWRARDDRRITPEVSSEAFGDRGVAFVGWHVVDGRDCGFDP